MTLTYTFSVNIESTSYRNINREIDPSLDQAPLDACLPGCNAVTAVAPVALTSATAAANYNSEHIPSNCL